MNKGHGVSKIGNDCAIKQQQQQKTVLPSKINKIITLEIIPFTWNSETQGILNLHSDIQRVEKFVSN